MYNDTMFPLDENGGDLSLPICHSRLVRIDSASICLAVVNMAAILLNILHMIVLSSMSSLRKTPYFLILIYITVIDIQNSLSNFLTLSLSKYEYFLNNSTAALIAYTVFNNTVLISRGVSFATASLERLIALCYPMSYDNSRYVSYLHKWLPVSFSLSVALYAVAGILTHNSICFTSMYGPLNLSIYTGLFVMVLCGAPTVMTVILMGRIFLEMWRMRSRRTGQQDSQVKRSTQYLVVIVSLYYSCVLPSLLICGLMMADIGPYNPSATLYVLYFVPSSVYGIMNTVIYGWMIQAYRQRIQSLFRRNRVGDMSSQAR